MSSWPCTISKVPKDNLYKNTEKQFFNVLYIHTFNNQKETTVLDRQEHNI